MLGMLSLGILSWMGIVGSPWSGVRLPAVVEAGRTFSLSVVEGGRVQWNLRDGRRPGGSSLLRQSVRAYDGGDQVELALVPGVAAGESVRAGQQIASLRSVREESRLLEQRSERASLLARRQLLMAGGRPEVVAEAERNLDVVRARREVVRVELDRARSLAELGLISAVDLEKLQASDDVHRLQIEHAAAAVDVARATPRTEELASLDARIAAIDATIHEAEALLAGTTVLAPIDGVARVGEDNAALDILDLRTIYLAVGVPMHQRARLELGAPVEFTPATAPQTVLTGTLIEISEETVLVRGAPSVWASVVVDNGSGALAAGMSGMATIAVDRSPWRYLAGLGRSILQSLS